MRRTLITAPLALAGVLMAATACGSKAANDNTTLGQSPTVTVTSAPASPAQTATNTGAPPKKTTAPPAPSWPTPEDCISYNPNNLTSHYEAGIWAINDGSKEVMRLHGGPSDTEMQAQALAVAKRFRKHCFIGNGNTREEKYSYIFDYWRDSSGMKPTIPNVEDLCSDYNRNNLTVEDMGGGDGWRVKDHDHVLHLFDNGTDARNGKLVLSKYSKECYLGNDPDDNQGQDLVSFQL
jgi:hypothetical protein